MRIKVAGPCASGKTSLAIRLRSLDFDAASTAQDHSYVPDMWQRINPPDMLIYLDVTIEEVHRRGRTGMGWDQAYLDSQNHRLRHARAHCDFYLMTDGLTEDQVLARVIEFLHSRRPSNGAAGGDTSTPRPTSRGKSGIEEGA